MSNTTFRRTSFVLSKPTVTNQVREKERFELSTLNDKFADYVEKVRYLEAQNKKIQLESNYLLEKQDENTRKLKTLFESEITQLKSLAENLFQNKNSAFSNSQDTQNSISVLKQRLNQSLKQSESSKYESESVERELSSIDGNVLMYKRRLVHQDNEHSQWKQFLAHIQRLLIQAKNEIHNETVARSSSEQSIKQIRSEIHRLREQHQDLKQSSTVFNTNSNNDRAHVFKSELSSAIRRIRQEFDQDNDRHRNELYEQFTRSYDEISRQYPELGHLYLNEREQDRIRQEGDRVRTELQRLRTDSQTIKQKNAELKLRIRELQINLDMSVEENQRLEQMQNNQLNQFRLKHQQTNKDYEDVISKQTTLEKEIETYRSLLEGTMKPVIDHITEEYGSFVSQQGGKTDQRHESSHRKTNVQSEFFLGSTGDLNNQPSPRPLLTRQKSMEFKVPSLDLPKVVDETHRESEMVVEEKKTEMTNVRPTIIIQTRRNN